MHSILGLLDVRPMTGYDLKKAFDGSVGYFWNADQAQIYRTLSKLSSEGLVDVGVVTQEGRPDRKEHRLTATGREELTRWLYSPIPAEPSREPFLARIFFAGSEQDPELVRSLISARRAAANEQLQSLTAIETSHASLADRLRAATLDNGIQHIKTELAWLDQLEEEL